MSKYHVIHGDVVVGDSDGGRKSYKIGQTFDMSPEDAEPLLEAGTIGKGSRFVEGEEPPTTTPQPEQPQDDDAARVAASKGAPEGATDPKKSSAAVRSDLKKNG